MFDDGFLRHIIACFNNVEFCSHTAVLSAQRLPNGSWQNYQMVPGRITKWFLVGLPNGSWQDYQMVSGGITKWFLVGLPSGFWWDYQMVTGRITKWFLAELPNGSRQFPQKSLNQDYQPNGSWQNYQIVPVPNGSKQGEGLTKWFWQDCQI